MGSNVGASQLRALSPTNGEARDRTNVLTVDAAQARRVPGDLSLEELVLFVTRALTWRIRDPGESPLSPAKLRVLDRLRSEPILMGEVAAVMRLTKPAATLAIDQLEQDGLVVRMTDDSDRRRINVRLTRVGEERRVRLQEDHVARARAVLADYPDDDLVTLREVLLKLGEAAHWSGLE
jgi:DNA-binding MarR family transcriptional regulator